MNVTPADGNRLTVELADYDLLRGLLGEHDRNLARIEQRLQVSLSCFGNTIEVIGDQVAAPRAQAALQALCRHLESMNGSKTMDLGTVDAAVNWALHSGGPDGEPDFSSFGDPATTLVTWKRPISPRSVNQREYVQRLLDAELVVGLGPAGTGKTYLAVAVAVALLRKGLVERVVLSRPAVEAGERLGFLPGDMREKVDPYLRPLYDALHDMMPADRVERMVAGGEIEIAPLAFMRGRTLAHAFVILDEAQNTTPVQMKMFLTRMGENSRMCVTGDLSQIDLPPGTRSGLRDALEILPGMPGVGITEFTTADVVRHALVARIVTAYDRRDAARRDGRDQ